MIEEHQLRTFRDRVASAFMAGMPQFPHFTLHGREHLDELDRLCSLVAGAIPKLANDRRSLDLLRLAIVLHDFAMVDVADPDREAELRESMGPTLSFADVVRKTHQDEIVASLNRRADELFGIFTNIEQEEATDAITIARFHRFHPLAGAPDKLRGLCALMRLIDELDIGPARAPRSAYKSRSARMDLASKFHWIKHVCTARIAEPATFFRESMNDRHKLLFCVAVLATEETWRCIQKHVYDKLASCVDEDGVGEAIREEFGVRVMIRRLSDEDHGCGVALVSVPEIRDDLANLVGTEFCPGGGESGAGDDEVDEEAVQPEQPPLEADGVAQGTAPHGWAASAVRGSGTPEDELRIFAISPEKLPLALCRSGRLTLIGNEYIPAEEESIGGTKGAPSRIYVGPADCGKTRAALEWVTACTAEHPSAWVVLRTDMGTIPEDVRSIVLDRSLYGDAEHPLPQKAVLFLDDLPVNLPPAGTERSATDSVRRLFAWFSNHPYFRERRVLGTIRSEDVHCRPDWPGVLPSLGVELELVSLSGHSRDQYRRLWRGMAHGTVSVSQTDGERAFEMELDEGFIDMVAERSTNPEAVAMFILHEAARHAEHLKPEDAARFRDSAVEAWLEGVWPAMRDTYGVAACVFHTIARFLEAGLRPASGFKGSLRPAWDYHKAFGPDLCDEHGGGGEGYMAAIDRIARDGHATGSNGEWIRPRWDFILQAEHLPAVEFPMPGPEWFAERAPRLKDEVREAMATHLVAAGLDVPRDLGGDSVWLSGWAAGKALLARFAADRARQVVLRDEAIDAYRKAVEANPRNDQAWTNLGVRLGQRADAETDPERQAGLRQEQIDAYRKAVEANPRNDQAWTNLGIRLGQRADGETDPERQAGLLQEEIDAYRKAVEANPRNDQAWTHLGISLGQRADAETDPERQAGLRQEQIDAYRKAVEANPDYGLAWMALGLAVGRLADAETDPERQAGLRQEQIDAYRKAVDANPRNDQAWTNLGISLGQRADAETDPERQAGLRQEQIDAYRKAVEANPDYGLAWMALGLAVGRLADAETDPDRQAGLRQEEIDAYRKAVDANPRKGGVWSALSAGHTKLWRCLRDDALLEEAISLAKRAVSLEANPYNLACALALAMQLGEAFPLLSECLEGGKIAWSHVAKDEDWDHLRDHPEYVMLEGLFGSA